MFLSDASLKRPIAVTVGLVALAIFGVIAYRGIGVDLVPQVDGMDSQTSPFTFVYDDHCKALVDERGAMSVVGFGLQIDKITY